MIQEEKELLIKDLCARQLYGVKVSVGRDRMNDYIEPEVENYLTLYYINPQRLECIFKECWWAAYIGAIRPYLRPMSSMTEEEVKEFAYTILQQPDLDAVRSWQTLSIDLKELPKVSDWLNKKKFDYHGLIEKGLALEAPAEMYNENSCVICECKDYCSQSEYVKTNCYKLNNINGTV